MYVCYNVTSALVPHPGFGHVEMRAFLSLVILNAKYVRKAT